MTRCVHPASPASGSLPSSLCCLLPVRQSRKLRKQLRVAMQDGKEKINAIAEASSAAVAHVRELTATLKAAASADKKPTLQLLYYQAVVKTAGEVFDVTCFAGVSQYHCLRTHGECDAAHLSSCHLRATDFEQICQPDAKSKNKKEDFAKNTRGCFMPALTYMASIHLAWGLDSNADNISSKSSAVLQSTRADLNQLRDVTIDPVSEIVTVILDVVTDKKHFHLTSPPSSDTDDSDEYSLSAAMEAMASDNTAGQLVEATDVAELVTQLAYLRTKDLVPLKFIADAIAPLAHRCHTQGKELHLLLLGCNTIQLVPHLKTAIPPEEAGCVTVMCTSEVWPSDCSMMLWHLYGATVRTNGLSDFRAGTRTLIGEYTSHYQRQRIIDETREELGIADSLANAVHCDRLDNVVVSEAGHAKMAIL